MTPHEVMLCVQANQERELHDYRVAVVTAWRTVAYDRRNALPSLRFELEQLEPKKPVLESNESAEELFDKVIHIGTNQGWLEKSGDKG